jgi:DNA-binding NarL/FixJ family response regulator
VRILIVDDHAIIREGLRRLLSPAGEHTFAEAADGDQGLALARDFRPHLIILDLNLPGLGGFELLRRLVKTRYGRVLVLSMHAEPQYARRALDAGAYGYVSKNATPEELLSAVARIGQGGRYVEADLAQALVLESAATGENLNALTPRETEILRLLGQGSSLAEIGRLLGVSYKTVANNCTEIKSKLGVTRTVDLLRLAIATQPSPATRMDDRSQD